jgi:cytochrome c oxidase subunit 4
MAGTTGTDGHGHENENVDGHVGGHGNEPHIVPVLTYLLVFGALLFGTWLTVFAAGRDFGAYNTVVALAIAITKATLVILFFMHVKYSARLTQLVVATAVVFLLLLVLGTLVDYYSPNVDGKLQPAHLRRQ